MIKTTWTSIAFLDGSQCLNYVVHCLFPCSWSFVCSWSFGDCLDLSFAASTELRAVLSSGSEGGDLIILWFECKGFTHSH